MANLWVFLPFLVPVLVANLSERHRLSRYVTRDPQFNAILDWGLRYLPHSLLIAINLGLLSIAAFALLNHFVVASRPQALGPETPALDWWAVAIACLLTAFLAFLPLNAGVRRWLARWLPIDPDSFVHATALTFAVYQIGLSLGQMALIGDLENLAEPELSLTVVDVLLSGLPLLVFALAGVGMLIRRDGRSTLKRLGLLRLTWRQLVAAAGTTIALLGGNFLLSAVWQEMDPAGYDLLDRVTENLFGGLATPVGALVLGLSAGISEELLFRGAVQPRLGLLMTTILFTIGHLQYGPTPATLGIFIIGLTLGLMRNRSSTTICIIIHAGYNTATVLLGMLQP